MAKRVFFKPEANINADAIKEVLSSKIQDIRFRNIRSNKYVEVIRNAWVGAVIRIADKKDAIKVVIRGWFANFILRAFAGYLFYIFTKPKWKAFENEIAEALKEGFQQYFIEIK